MEKIGIIVGNGDLPILLINECKKKNIKPYLVLLKGFANPQDYLFEDYIEIFFGEVGKAISFFKKNTIKKIIFVGGVKKPDLWNIHPDFKGSYLLMKILKSKIFGDDTILKTIINFLNKDGFDVISIDEISNSFKINLGLNGTTRIADNNYMIDIDLGIKVLKQLGDLDIGQSVIIQNGIVLGIECIEGTEQLIKRCKNLKYLQSRKPILVKIKKTNQTKKIDLPAIGKETILQLKDAGFAGIAFDSENGIIINYDETIKLAEENQIFIYGIKV